jgi:hypothetical protein
MKDIGDEKAKRVQVGTVPNSLARLRTVQLYKHGLTVPKGGAHRLAKGALTNGQCIKTKEL